MSHDHFKLFLSIRIKALLEARHSFVCLLEQTETTVQPRDLGLVLERKKRVRTRESERVCVVCV